MTAIQLFNPERGFQRLERYELIGEIASGGMATVYLARLRGAGGFQRYFAIKCLLPHLAQQPGFVEMFLDEARLSAAIRHPNVVPILEVGANSGCHFIVMDFVEGDCLAGLLEHAVARRLPLPVPIALRIALDMLMGLHAAHELQDDKGSPLHLIHRDVSPQNVLVGVDGIAKISDFGIARATSRLSSTREGQLKGKLAYMAPEYIQGDKFVDRRADIFSAGIVIWEMLAMTRLFKCDNEAATLARILMGKPPILHEVAPHVPERTGAAIMRALEHHAAMRFATCAEFAEAIEESCRGGLRPATSRELANYVQRAMGENLSQQRRSVRSCISRLEKLLSENTRIDPKPRDSVVPITPVSLIRSTRTDATTTSSSRDITTHPPHTWYHVRGKAIALLALSLGVLGTGGALGAYFAVRTTHQGDFIRVNTHAPQLDADERAEQLPRSLSVVPTKASAPAAPVLDLDPPSDIQRSSVSQEKPRSNRAPRKVSLGSKRRTKTTTLETKDVPQNPYRY